ncbi:MAG: hypothetical protein ACR2KG_04820 [Nocardioidaceae bacterium]
MLLIIFALLVAVVLAVLVTAYVAYPSRGMEIPHARRLTAAMLKVRDKILL